LKTTVVPGWVKVVLLFTVAAGLGWWSWHGSKEAAGNDTDAAYSRPRPNLEAGLPGQAQSNVRQLFVNPLEQAPPCPTDVGGTLRDSDQNYYKDQ